MEGLTEGRMVHFVDPTGEHNAAVVTNVKDKQSGMVNLHVFNKGDFQGTSDWKDVPYSDKAAKMTWHWIEKA